MQNGQYTPPTNLITMQHDFLVAILYIICLSNLPITLMQVEPLVLNFENCTHNLKHVFHAFVCCWLPGVQYVLLG